MLRKKAIRNVNPDKIYISEAIPTRYNLEYVEEYMRIMEEQKRPVRFEYGSKYYIDYQRKVSFFMEKESSYKYEKTKEGIILRKTTGGTQEIRVELTEVDRNLRSLVLQRFSSKTGTPHKNSFSFEAEEIIRLRDFLNSLELIPIEGGKHQAIEFKEVKELKNLTTQISKNKKLIQEILDKNITEVDIALLKYRKKQLEVFRKLLDDNQYFNDLLEKKKLRGKETLWQAFFEKNSWIFGYGLSYIYSSNLDDKKLEQVVNGYTFNERGKRADGVMKTRGLLNMICFAEIKHHKTKLINHKLAYRSDCWKISEELNGAVVQSQKTVQKAKRKLEDEIRIKDKNGNPTGEIVYMYQPKSFIVVGNLEEFNTENGVNAEKLSSFELFRQNLVSPEIITFDELYERAKFIVEQEK